MSDDDALLKSIPSFLRRPAEPWPESPLFGIGTGRAGDGGPPPAPGPEANIVALAPGRDRAAVGDPAAGAPDFFARSRAEIVRRLDAAPAPTAEDAPVTIEIALPAAVARALAARAARQGCDQSAVVLAALRGIGLADRASASEPAAPRTRRRRRRRA